jgi:mono/diheme cytochrome c family protein
VPGGGGAFGPNLTGGVELRQFPTLADGIKKHIEFITTGSDFQKQYGTQGIGSGRMPGFGQMLTPEQIQQIVTYERSL